MRTFKLVLIGDGGVGKTSWITLIRTGEFCQRYISTKGVDVTVLTFHTTRGVVKFNVWDFAGLEKYCDLGDGYYIGANCAIVMFDVNSRISHKNSKQWETVFRRVNDTVPLLTVGNKCDLPMKSTEMNQADYLISSNTEKDFGLPFLHLIRSLLNDYTIDFVEY